MKKAGRLEIGEAPVHAICKARKSVLVVVSSDAAENSLHRALSFAQLGQCPAVTLPCTKSQLGNTLGRTSCAMAALTDAGFAANLARKLCAIDPDSHSTLASSLEEKAQRVLQRQKEKRTHEKRLLREKGIPPASKRKQRE